MGEDRETSQDPGFAARCLLRRACWATLATQSGGQPSASLVTPAAAPDGSVLMLLSALAEHTHHLLADPRCAVLVAGEAENLNWQTAPRLTLGGTAVRDDDPSWRRYWTEHHPYTRLYADFADFAIWRLVPENGLLVAGFGRVHRLPAHDLACPAASVASLAAAQSTLVDSCNTRHAASLNRMAHAAGHDGRWAMLSLDPDGFSLIQDETVLRMAFRRPVAEASEIPAALVALERA